MRVVCLANPLLQRSIHIASAMRDGFRHHGVRVVMEDSFAGIRGDLLVAYGWNHHPAFDAYRAAGRHFFYVDLGYWHRKAPGQRLDGYHKVVLDGWCPSATMRRGAPSDRFDKLGIIVQPQRRSGKKIIVAGMSAKSANDHGLSAEHWERATIARLSTQTKKPLVYRPKPSWDGARPIAGAEYSSKDQDLAALLRESYALITHHSNAAIDAVIAGVPMFCEKGVGSTLSTVDIDHIDAAMQPPDADRMQLLYDVAYLQWNVSEMRDGTFWEHHKGVLQ